MPTDTPAFKFGQPVISWEIDEYPRYFRSRTWYVIAGLIGVLLLIYAIATANFLFAVIILMFGIIMLLSTFKEPNQLKVAITTAGVMVGDAFYPYQDIRNFSVVFDPPTVKLLYIDFGAFLRPMLAIPLAEIDPNKVRSELLPYCQENTQRAQESLIDLLRRVYKL